MEIRRGKPMTKKLSDFTKIKSDKSSKNKTHKKTLPSNQVRIGVTLRIVREDWERLHYLSIQERTKIQKLLLEGINKIFELRGLEKMRDE